MHDERPERLQALVRDAVRAREAGDHDAALDIANRAASERLAHPLLIRIRAAALRDAGRLDEAGQLLNRALALDPRDAATILDLGRVLAADDRRGEAVQAYQAALELRPELVEAWMALGAAHAGNGEFAAARAAFGRAAELAPQDADPRANLAYMDARTGRTEDARAHANEALRLDANHVLAGLALARADYDRQEFESARERLEALFADQRLNRSQRQIVHNLLGDTYDKLGRVDDAFEMYRRMKDTFVARHRRRYGEGGPVESHLAFIERLSRWFERQAPSSWGSGRASAASPVRRHVFLLGYLRSGVTLVESILASLPDTRVLEEGATLEAADAAFLKDDTTLARLNPLDPELADAARAAYWRRARELVPDLDGKVFVDMSPLYGIKLPMITRLFPDAVVVVCRRDPRDVVLSCFRRHFSPNALTFQMTSPESIARHYDAAMQLTERHLEGLPLRWHLVEYSQLVANFDESTRALADFVGAPWSERVRNFSGTAARMNIRTPSASQVRRGLFDGTAQWRRYRGQLEPVLPQLQPWVDKFGYPP